jgi:large-conductance mechanosensitive channel
MGLAVAVVFCLSFAQVAATSTETLINSVVAADKKDYDFEYSSTN